MSELDTELGELYLYFRKSIKVVLKLKITFYISQFQVTTEFRRYTVLSLVAEIGGYVGLLMGYSFLNITKLVSPVMTWATYFYGALSFKGGEAAVFTVK